MLERAVNWRDGRLVVGWSSGYSRSLACEHGHVLVFRSSERKDESGTARENVLHGTLNKESQIFSGCDCTTLHTLDAMNSTAQPF